MISTVKDIANAPEYKDALRALLDNPIIQTALRVLKDDNMPELQINLAPGMDAMQSIALDYAKRCGAHSIIKRLQTLPYLTSKVVDKAVETHRPWEYLLSEEMIAAQEKSEQVQDKKPIRKPKST